MRAVLLLFAAVAALFAATNSSRDGCKQCQKEREAYCKSYPAASTCQSLDNCGFVFTNSTQTCLQIMEAEFNGSPARRPSLVLERSRRGKRKVQEASYEIDPQIDISMVYVKVIKAASSTTGGVARRVCVYFKLNHCTNAVFPGRKLEPGLWANHRSYKKLNGQLQRMAKPRFTYTILRDPAKRSMSYYYHFTASKKVRLFFDGTQNISLTKGQPHDGEKLEKIKYQKNWQYHYTCLPTDGKRFENGGETVESCMSHYDFVGLAERYDESMLVLRSRMMARFGKPIPMNRFWYVSSKVASDRGGRSDGAGFRFVHHKPLDQESRALQDYIANEYMADNTIDYEMIDRINKDLDVHIQAAGPQFATDLHVFKCQMKVAATVCGHHANNQKMKCYWNDNGCNYLCLDMVADYINRDGKDVVKMAGDTEGHADILEMTRLWNVEGLGQHVPSTLAENNGLASTPPMGWNPWNCYASNGAHEDIVLAAAHAMVDKLGPPYQYINLDCGWSTKHRDPVTGLLQVNTTRFPHGMKWLGAQIHALGLKFGMYGAMGYGQCCSGSADNTADDGSGPGCSRSKLKCRNETFYDRDAQLWASWGVDLVKFDGCGGSFDSIVPMRDALKKTGRPIVYSVHGQVLEGQMKTELANFWRVGADIGANYEQIIDRAWTSNNVSMYLHAGKGGWNDPDMLQVGNLVAGKCPGGQSCPPSLFPDAEGRTQFALWCITKAPLLIGTFIHNVSGVTLDTVTNKVAISVNQDTLGVQGMLRKSGGYFPDGTRPVKNSAYGFQIWSGALSNGGAAAALCNLNGNGTQPITLTTLEMPSTRNTVGQKWDIVEAFTGAKQAGVVLPRTVVVGPHDVALWVLTPQPSDVAV